MWLLLVTVAAYAASVEAGYEYNAPNRYNTPLGLSGIQASYHHHVMNLQPQHIKTSQNAQDEDKQTSLSISNSGYDYLKNGNVQNNLPNINQFNINYNNPQVNDNFYPKENYDVLSASNLQFYGEDHFNNRKTENTDFLLQQKITNDKTASLPVNNIQDHSQKSWTPIFNDGNNIVHNQNSISHKGTNLYNQPLNKSPVMIDPATTNYNKVQNSVFGLNSNDNHNNVHIHTMVPPAIFNDLYNSNTYTMSVTGGDNNDYIREHTTQLHDSINNGISQASQGSATFNNEFKSVPQESQLNDAFKQASVSLNNKYKQPVISSIGVNLDSGYEYNYPPSATLNSNNAYIESASAISDINQNTGYVKSSLPTAVTAEQNLYQNNLNSRLDPNPADTFSNIKVTPIIHKHIYFHIPPPEIENPQKLASPPPVLKKDYNILFIKMPPHTPRSNLVDIHENIAQAAVEEKTLIYVLVKKPEDPQSVILPTPNRSQHQVFFVKYNGDPFDIASQVNDELEETGSVDSIVPLSPGLVNGLK